MASKNKPLLIHVDVDSPLKLMDFYKLKGIAYSDAQLESFYEISWQRALDFFDQHHIKATFFVVGDELEKSTVIQSIIKKAHAAGHDIENHTYSHPFGLAGLPKETVIEEIQKCNAIISSITGRKPIGFRSPGYSMSSDIINLLEENGFKYDSSGFWSVMNTVLKYSHKFLYKDGLKNEGFGQVNRHLPQQPYTPDTSNWLRAGKGKRNFTELPLPRTSLMKLPFYNNFNLWAPALYSNAVAAAINKPYLVYLFHIIEFMDMQDDIPKELAVHPNIKTPVALKLKRSGKIIDTLKKRYSPALTSELPAFK